MNGFPVSSRHAKRSVACRKNQPIKSVKAAIAYYNGKVDNVDSEIHV